MYIGMLLKIKCIILDINWSGTNFSNTIGWLHQWFVEIKFQRDDFHWISGSMNLSRSSDGVAALLCKTLIFGAIINLNGHWFLGS